MRVATIALVALCTACATPVAQTTPEPIVAFEGYTQALNKGDIPAAYQFLGKEIRGSMTLESFERLYQRHGEAMKKEASSLLNRMRETPPREEVWISIGTQRAHLIRTNDGWQMTDVFKAEADAKRDSDTSRP